MKGLQTAESATVPAAVPKPLPLLRLLYATVELMQTLYLGICPLMTHKEASGLGRIYLYNQPLRSGRKNERTTTAPKICLSAF